jgi:hypothetical protein
VIAMQYGFALPADYDMDVIRRRITDKGHLLDDFPGLAFKAYLHATRADARLPSRENLYAPFYLWHDADAMQRFLCGEGFANLAGAFGWPSVRHWQAWAVELALDARAAVSASRELVDVAPHATLSAARAQEASLARRDRAAGALAAVAAIDPRDWTLVRLRLWDRDRADLAGERVQLYAVGHVSVPSAASAGSTHRTRAAPG